jgi:tetrahydromethanopterin S-methyltransferase subunit B
MPGTDLYLRGLLAGLMVGIPLGATIVGLLALRIIGRIGRRGGMR